MPLHLYRRQRSIPACAGEPVGADEAADKAGVYPRVCGGTDDVQDNLQRENGLSPRVRGNPAGAQAAGELGGSIPACAGEPEGAWVKDKGKEVYPRVCGGTVAGHPVGVGGKGLSPRVRGNRRAPAYRPPGARSIPACAGEPDRQNTATLPRAVYPRVCGGTMAWRGRRAAHCGLSPRVRGNPRPALGRAGQWGSIPACAGEPHLCGYHTGNDEVYPRVCGGTYTESVTMLRLRGLSPRVRGNPQRQWLCQSGTRSIPACAGEPQSIHGDRPPPVVYPRVCGGTCIISKASGLGRGLSPRVRGNLAAAEVGDAPVGSIPACAGEPVLGAQCWSERRVYPRVCGGT